MIYFLSFSDFINIYYINEYKKKCTKLLIIRISNISIIFYGNRIGTSKHELKYTIR